MPATPAAALRSLTSILSLSLLVSNSAFAMDETLVTATRVTRDALTLPHAVGIVEADDIQRRQLIGLDESMGRIPGVYFSNRYNYSRDLRISIRGFGARSNFGVRGIKVYVDGVPSTVADGQTALDDLDLSNVERVEVIRGPSSALYGASAGGVINIFTQDGPETPFAEAGVLQGSHDFDRYQFKTGGQHGKLNYFINGSYLNFDGFRERSNVEHSTVSGKFRYDFSDGSTGQMIIRATDSPTADDAGGLTADEVALDRGQARQRNADLDSGETVEDQKVAFSWNKTMGVHQISLRNYYNWRDFSAKLPLPPFAGTGIIQFDRFFFGGGAQYNNTSSLFGHGNRFTFGVDVDSQSDERQRFNNLSGSRGPLAFDQEEKADTVGVFMQNEFAVTEQVNLQASVRYDDVEFEIEDRFTANGDQSDTISFSEINYMFGAAWSPMQALNLYGNYATAFETPTFTEFANPSSNGTLGGFANVAPQRTKGFEFGAKGILFDRVRYELAYFDMDIEDEVTAVTNIGGRAFFNNADTERSGIEFGLGAQILEGLEFNFAYTYNDFEFDRFASNLAAEGQTLPGVPEHYLYLEFDYVHKSGAWVKWDWAYIGSIFADNVNATKVDSYDVSNLVFGYDYKAGKITLSPNFGINNLFDESYNQEIRIQAFGGRFFEPAPKMNLFGGVRLRYDFDI